MLKGLLFIFRGGYNCRLTTIFLQFLLSINQMFQNLKTDSVISAWARVGRTDKAEEVLKKANEIRTKYNASVTDIFTYNSIAHGYLKNNDLTNSLEKILKIK